MNLAAIALMLYRTTMHEMEKSIMQPLYRRHQPRQFV